MHPRAQKVIIFEHEHLGAETGHCSATIADMGRRVLIDILLVAADGRFA